MANTATIEAHLRIIEGMYKELEKFAHDLQEVIDLSESCDISRESLINPQKMR